MIDEEILEVDLTGQTADQTEEILEVVAEVVEPPRLFLFTPFEEYTVVEGFLLLFLILTFISSCFKLLKEGFFWLW